jgi:restriction endonuclease S subunit
MTFSIIQKSQLEGAKRIDAEYYQQEYLNLLNQLKKIQLSELDKITTKIDVGFVSSMVSHFKEKGIPLLRTQNVNEFFIDLTNDLIFIDKEFHQKLKKSQVFSGDVLLARSGSIGNASVVPSNFPIANSADIILIKTNKILPEYLSAFLNSRYGQFQIERGVSGGLQGHINLYSLEKLLIPIIDNGFQETIKKIVLSGLNELDNSKFLYSQAEDLLLEELELKDFKFKNDLFFVVDSSKAKGRIDADYFQPKYEQLISQLNKFETKNLSDLVSIKKGFEPGSETYEEEGKLFIRVSSLSKYGIDNKDQKYLKDDLYQKLKKDFQPQVGEILLTKDASPGVAYVIKEPVVGIISGGILRLKLKEQIELEYLTLCINSVVGQMQAERDAGGSVIEHWKPEEIKNLVIPILPTSTQQKIAELVRKSHEARKKSKELLKEAKRKVEEVIEKGGK